MQQPVGQNDPKLFSSAEENQYFDRKSARKDVKEISRHIIAFANASGGKLVIGIEDNGDITGFKRNGAHSVEDFEQAALTYCVPVPHVTCTRLSVDTSSSKGDFILVLDIEASPDRVISRKSDKRSIYAKRTVASSSIVNKSKRLNTTKINVDLKMKLSIVLLLMISIWR